MKKLIVVLTIVLCIFGIVFPKNFGKHTHLWDLEKRSYGNEYFYTRNKYFISYKYKRNWSAMSNVLRIFVQHDSLSITEAILYTTDTDDNIVINNNGAIYWYKPYNKNIDYYKTSVAENTPIIISINNKEYNLEFLSEDLKEKYYIDIEGKVEALNQTRNEYNRVLKLLVEEEKQRVYDRAFKTLLVISVIWIIWIIYRRATKWEKRRKDKMLDSILDEYKRFEKHDVISIFHVYLH